MMRMTTYFITVKKKLKMTGYNFTLVSHYLAKKNVNVTFSVELDSLLNRSEKGETIQDSILVPSFYFWPDML